MRFLCLFLAVILILPTANLKSSKKGKRRKGCPAECTMCERTKEFPRGLKADCSSSNISIVPQTFADKMWIELDLSENFIDSLDEESFCGQLFTLKFLNLASNRISEIHSLTFKKLTNLENLKLEGNRLTIIPDNLFSYSVNIGHLVLSGNHINNITEGAFLGLRNLKFLHLDGNQMTHIPVAALRQTPLLQFLTMSLNKIETIPNEAFKLLAKLEVLDLRENRIAKIEKRAMQGMHSCLTLDLTYNRLTEYPTAITELIRLEELAINDNQISKLPDRAFSQQTGLTHLDFHNNPLKSVGRWTFTNLHRVKSLSIMDVSEQEYFPDFSGCYRLETLSVTGGRIYTLPKDLCNNMTSLKKLNIANNMLYNLSGISACYNLESLDASGNSFAALHDVETRNLTKLSDLNLSNNNIVDIEENALENMNLSILNLAENSFSLMPIEGIRLVRTLNVSGVYNMLYFPPPELFYGLRHLEATYAYHCCEVFKENAKGWKPNITCSPEPSPLTPCDSLINPVSLRATLWSILIISTIVNLLIITTNAVRTALFVYRQVKLRQSLDDRLESDRNNIDDEKLQKYASSAPSNRKDINNIGTFEIALCHLALADLIGSAYLGTIVSYDWQTRGVFYETGSWWQQSVSCKAAGFVLVTGIQLSLFTILIAAVERYLSTMYPLNPEKHFGKPVMCLTLAAAWVISIATAVVTLYRRKDRTSYPDNPFPSYNGATCLPWSTDFIFVAVLVGSHIVACLFVAILCVLMYCAKRKQSWLSAQKNTRLQITLTVSCNIFLIFPLALIGLLASAIATYPSSTESWINPSSYSTPYFTDKTVKFNVELLQVAVLLLISLRFMLNPLLYILFSHDIRTDCMALLSTLSGLWRYYFYRNGTTRKDAAMPKTVSTELPFQGSDGEVSEEEDALFQPSLEHAILNEEEIVSEEEFYRNHYIPGCVSAYGVPSARVEGVLHPYLCPVLQPPCHLYYQEVPHSSYSNDVRSSSWHSHYQPSFNCRSDPFSTPVVYKVHPPPPQRWKRKRKRKIKEETHPKRPLYEETSVASDDYEPDSEESESLKSQTSLSDSHSTSFKNVLRETKGKLPPLTIRQYDSCEAKPTCNVNDTKLLQSCESSTSKDSGIQSEPDFGVRLTGCSGKLTNIQLSKLHSNGRPSSEEVKETKTDNVNISNFRDSGTKVKTLL